MRPVPRRPSAVRRRAALSLAVSALVHVGAALALEHLALLRPAELLPAQTGRASLDSIELVISESPPAEPMMKPEPSVERAVAELAQQSPPEEAPAAAAEAAVPPLERPQARVAPARLAERSPLPPVPPEPASSPPSVETPPPPDRIADEPSLDDPRRAGPSRHAASATRVDASADVSSVASRASAGADADGPPRVVVNPAPVYPPELLSARIEGRVVLRVRVGADGRVLGLAVLRTSGRSAFDEAALAAVRAWRFQPARRGGLPIEAEVAVPVRFVVADEP